MADYSAAIVKAETQIRAKGMPMMYVRVEECDEYDPVTDSYPTTETRLPIFGLKSQPTVNEVQGGVFAAGSMVVLVAGIYFKESPDTTDYLEFSGKRWSIATIKGVTPAGEAILYKLQVADAGTIA